MVSSILLLLAMTKYLIQFLSSQVFQFSPSSSFALFSKTPAYLLSDGSECLSLTPAQREERLRHKFDNVDRVFQFTNEVHEYIYLRKPKILMYFMLKAGSRAFLEWIYRGVTGMDAWSDELCQTYIHDLNSPCWKDHADFVMHLDIKHRWHLFTANDVMRVALQRDPYQRLLSAYKSKYTCEKDKFYSDVNINYVTMLRKQANMSISETSSSSCMDISEFANVLDRIRTVGGSQGVHESKWIESHVRPQDVHADEIDFDIIIDSQFMKYPHCLSFIYERLPYRDNITSFVPEFHTSGNATLSIPSEAEHKLQLFAGLSKVAPLKNCDRKQ